MVGALHVEHWRGETTQPFPIVMVHGGGQTGTCFTAKPDGGEGWAQAFARLGFEVYVIDERSRGRSPHAVEIDPPFQPVFTTESAEQLFTAAAHHKRWPSAGRHDQWPGSGRRGDPVFDRFYASQTPQLRNGPDVERAAADALVALLRQVGPAVLLTHSQGGPRGWLAADIAPDLVEGIVAVEPMGRPFYWTRELAAVFGVPADVISHPYGITHAPITYAPAVGDPAVLLGWREAPNQGRWRLVNLARIPVVIVTGEASYHRSSDVEIAEYPTAMGVTNRLLCLEDLGLTGNGHMMMLEMNSHAIAEVLVQVIAQWRLATA
jgi:pimeloyl-ACP methyl ester carboxylesterase